MKIVTSYMHWLPWQRENTDLQRPRAWMLDDILSAEKCLWWVDTSILDDGCSL